MQDLPRHLGQHSGGMVICQDDLSSVVPLENASMPGRVVVQWDKDDCADMGLIKVDLLGLGMMAVAAGLDHADQSGGSVWSVGESGSAGGLVGHVRPSRRRLRTDRPDRPDRPDLLIDLAHLPQDDAVYAMLRAADTIGVFQVESRAQMATLPRLKPVVLLRSRRPGRHHPPRPDRRADGASLSESPRGAWSRSSTTIPRSSRCSDAHARRAAVSGTAAAHGDGRGGLHRRSGRRAAPRHGLQAIREEDAADRSASARGHGEERHHRRSRRSHRAVDHVVCALRLSRIARGQLCAARLRERVSEGALPGRVLHRRSSTTSRWGSTIRRRSSKTRSAAASASRRSTCRSRTGTARSRKAASIRVGLRYVAGLREEIGKAIAAACRHTCPPVHPRLDQLARVRNAAATIRRCSNRAGFLQPMRASVDGRTRASTTVSDGRRSGAAHRSPPRRGDDARRDWRAQLLRPRSPIGVVASRARRAPGGRTV